MQMHQEADNPPPPGHEVEQLDFRSAEFVAQLARLRAGSLPQEELAASPFCALLHCVRKAEASAHAAIERAGSGSGWDGWCYPKVRGELDRQYVVVLGEETEEFRAARRAHWEFTAYFPQFLVADVQGLESRNTRLRAVRPEAVFTCGNWIVHPNPTITITRSSRVIPSGPRTTRAGSSLLHGGSTRTSSGEAASSGSSSRHRHCPHCHRWRDKSRLQETCQCTARALRASLGRTCLGPGALNVLTSPGW